MKVLAVLLSCVMLLSLCACSVEPAGSNGVDPNPNDSGIQNEQDEHPVPEEPTDEWVAGYVTPDGDDDSYDVPAEEDDSGVVPAEDDSYETYMESVSNDDFTLTLYGEKAEYLVGEEIIAEATLSLTGHESLDVYGGGTLVGFSIVGSTCFDDEQGAAIMTSELATYSFTNAEDAIYPLVKSGGYSASDPNYDFYKEFFSTEEYTLPAGVYTITCFLSYSTDSDDVIGTQKDLSLEYTFSVVDLCGVPLESEDKLTVEYNLYIDSDDDAVTYPYELPLSDEDIDTICKILENGEWKQTIGNCLNDWTFIYNGEEIAYHSDCGTFNDNTNMHCMILSEEDKTIINGILQNYPFAQ